MKTCSIQYIPKMEFEKVLKKVVDDCRERNFEHRAGNWGNVCSVSSAGRSDDEEVEDSVTRMNNGEVHTIFDHRSKRYSAPLFGPPRKYGKGWAKGICIFYG